MDPAGNSSPPASRLPVRTDSANASDTADSTNPTQSLAVAANSIKSPPVGSMARSNCKSLTSAPVTHPARSPSTFSPRANAAISELTPPDMPRPEPSDGTPPEDTGTNALQAKSSPPRPIASTLPAQNLATIPPPAPPRPEEGPTERYRNGTGGGGSGPKTRTNNSRVLLVVVVPVEKCKTQESNCPQ
jgi:hypothetical protein